MLPCAAVRRSQHTPALLATSLTRSSRPQMASTYVYALAEARRDIQPGCRCGRSACHQRQLGSCAALVACIQSAAHPEQLPCKPHFHRVRALTLSRRALGGHLGWRGLRGCAVVWGVAESCVARQWLSNIPDRCRRDVRNF